MVTSCAAINKKNKFLDLSYYSVATQCLYEHISTSWMHGVHIKQILKFVSMIWMNREI